MDTLIPNDQLAPDFSLPDLDGTLHSLSAYRGRVVVVNFWSAECPWAERGDEALAGYRSSWGDDVVLLSVASNANEPPELLARVSGERGLPLVLHDAGQQVADLYAAQTTPHLFVIDAAGILRYQGALDDVTFRRRKSSRAYLRDAVAAVLAGRTTAPEHTHPYGCSLVRYSS